MPKATTVYKSQRPNGPAKSARGQTRREMILVEAAKLFRSNGFHATGIDDIGAAVGITGPGVYRHFESKQELLAEILERSIQVHQEIVDDVARSELPPMRALEKLVQLSAEALAQNRDATAIYFQEARNLGPAEQTRFTKAQRLLITEWVQVLCAARPELDHENARVAVRAVAGLINSLGYFTTEMAPEPLGALLGQMALAALLASPSE